MGILFNNQKSTINDVGFASAALSIQGGRAAYVSSSSLSMGAGVFRSSDDTIDIVCSAGTVSTGSSGIGGFEGTLSSSIPVFLFAALNPTTGATGYFMSNSQSPTPPSGYTKTRRVGSWYRSGTSLIDVQQIGSESLRQYVGTILSVISFQNFTSGTWYYGSVAGICPTAHALEALLQINGQSSAGTSDFCYSSYGNTAVYYGCQVNQQFGYFGLRARVSCPIGETVGFAMRRDHRAGTTGTVAGAAYILGWTEEV